MLNDLLMVNIMHISPLILLLVRRFFSLTLLIFVIVQRKVFIVAGENKRNCYGAYTTRIQCQYSIHYA